MNRVAFPFLTIDETAVKVLPWCLIEDSREEPITGAWLPDWDAARDLHLCRRVTINFERTASLLDMPIDDATLEVVVRVSTGAGNVPRQIIKTSRWPLSLSKPENIFDVTVSGHSLSQRICVDTFVIRKTSGQGSPLSPVRAGSKLWADQLDLRLEGEEPRFPMEIVSFRKQFAHRPEICHAPWFLHWSPGSLHRDFGGSIRLYLNSDCPVVISRLSAGDSTTVQTILASVMFQITSAALRQEDFEELVQEVDHNSIAARAAYWISCAFPDQDIKAVRSMIDLAPSTFYTGILSAADIISLKEDNDHASFPAN